MLFRQASALINCCLLLAVLGAARGQDTPKPANPTPASESSNAADHSASAPDTSPQATEVASPHEPAKTSKVHFKVQLLLVRTDWSQGKDVADLDGTLKEVLKDIALPEPLRANLAKAAPAALFPNQFPVTYEPGTFAAALAWMRAHELVRVEEIELLPVHEDYLTGRDGYQRFFVSDKLMPVPADGHGSVPPYVTQEKGWEWCLHSTSHDRAESDENAKRLIDVDIQRSAQKRDQRSVRGQAAVSSVDTTYESKPIRVTFPADQILAMSGYTPDTAAQNDWWNSFTSRQEWQPIVTLSPANLQASEVEEPRLTSPTSIVEVSRPQNFQFPDRLDQGFKRDDTSSEEIGDDNAQKQVAVFRLKHADPNQVIRALTAAAPNAAAVTDDRLKSVIVTATKDNLTVVENLLKQLDQQYPADVSTDVAKQKQDGMEKAPPPSAESDLHFEVQLLLVRGDWSRGKDIQEDAIKELLEDVALSEALRANPLRAVPHVLFPRDFLATYTPEEFAGLTTWMKEHDVVRVEKLDKLPVEDDEPGEYLALGFQLQRFFIDNRLISKSLQTHVDPPPPLGKYGWDFYFRSGLQDLQEDALAPDMLVVEVKRSGVKVVQGIVSGRGKTEESIEKTSVSRPLRFMFPSDQVAAMHCDHGFVGSRPWWADGSESPEEWLSILALIPTSAESPPEASQLAKPASLAEINRLRDFSFSNPALVRSSAETAATTEAKRQLKIFHLVHARAEQMAAILRQLFPEITMSGDERTNSLIAQGEQGRLEAAEAVIQKLDETPSEKQELPLDEASRRQILETASSDFASAEAEIRSIVESIAGEADKKKTEQLRTRLTGLVAEAFDLRQKLQRAELALLKERVGMIESRLGQRETLRKEIIERRVEALLAREVDAGASSVLSAVGGASSLDGIDIESYRQDLEQAAREVQTWQVAMEDCTNELDPNHDVRRQKLAEAEARLDSLRSILESHIASLEKHMTDYEALLDDAIQKWQNLKESHEKGDATRAEVDAAYAQFQHTRRRALLAQERVDELKQLYDNAAWSAMSTAAGHAASDSQLEAFGKATADAIARQVGAVTSGAPKKDALQGAAPQVSEPSIATRPVLTGTTLPFRSPEEFALAAREAVVEVRRASTMAVRARRENEDPADYEEFVASQRKDPLTWAQQRLSLVREEFAAQVHLLELEVRTTEAAATTAQEELQRLTSYFKNGTVPWSQVSDAKLKAEQASVRLEQAKTLLDLYLKAGENPDLKPGAAKSPSQAPESQTPSHADAAGSQNASTPPATGSVQPAEQAPPAPTPRP